MEDFSARSSSSGQENIAPGSREERERKRNTQKTRSELEGVMASFFGRVFKLSPRRLIQPRFFVLDFDGKGRLVAPDNIERKLHSRFEIEILRELQ